MFTEIRSKGFLHVAYEDAKQATLQGRLAVSYNTTCILTNNTKITLQEFIQWSLKSYVYPKTFV